MRPRRRLDSLCVAVVLMPVAAACTDWRVENVDPAQWIAEAHPAEVQLERRDGPKLLLRNPTLAGTTIRGVHGADTLHVPLTSVTRISTKRTDWVETALLIAAPPALFFGLACLAACGY